MNNINWFKEFRITKRANGQYVVEKRCYSIQDQDYYCTNIINLENAWIELSRKDSKEEAIKYVQWVIKNHEQEAERYPSMHTDKFEHIVSVYENDGLKEFLIE